MNYIDLFIVVFTGLGLLIGLFGKAPKKIFGLLMVLLAVVIAYLTCGSLTTAVEGIKIQGQTLGEFIATKISNFVSQYNIPEESANALAQGIIKMLVFWAECIALRWVFGLIGTIISGIVFRHSKNGTAIFTLGLPGAVKGFIISLIFLFPVLVTAPVLGNVSSFMDEPPQAIVTVEKTVNTSKAVSLSDKFLKKTKLACLEYEVNGEKRSLYGDFQSLKGISKIAGVLLKETDGDKNPLLSLADIDEDDLREAFKALDESDTIKEIMSGAIEQLDLPVDIDVSNISFEQEADTIILLSKLVEEDEENPGEVNFTLENVTTDDFVNAMSTSSLIDVIAENAGGSMAGLDEDTKNEIDTKLQEKLAEGTIDQEKYDRLMNLFKQQSEE